MTPLRQRMIQMPTATRYALLIFIVRLTFIIHLALQGKLPRKAMQALSRTAHQYRRSEIDWARLVPLAVNQSMTLLLGTAFVGSLSTFASTRYVMRA
jgi:hypothetical protein